MSSSDDITAPPPPYSDEKNNNSSSSSSNIQILQTANPNSATYHLRSHISSLPARIRDSHAAHADRHAVQDSRLLGDVLAPHLEAFLEELGGLPHAPPSATLVLYPAAAMLLGNNSSSNSSRYGEGRTVLQAIQREPRLSGLDDMQRHGEFVRVQGVGAAAAMSSKDIEITGRDQKEDGRSGGRDLLWWKDEPMAKRLAAYLQPGPEEVPDVAPLAFSDADVTHRAQHEKIEKAEDKKTWGFRKLMGASSRSRCSGGTSQETTGPSSSSSSPLQPGVRRGHGVQAIDASALDTRAKMMVKAEEVTFRVENDMGLYESFNGFALVARVNFTGSRLR